MFMLQIMSTHLKDFPMKSIFPRFDPVMLTPCSLDVLRDIVVESCITQLSLPEKKTSNGLAADQRIYAHVWPLYPISTDKSESLRSLPRRSTCCPVLY